MECNDILWVQEVRHSVCDIIFLSESLYVQFFQYFMQAFCFKQPKQWHMYTLTVWNNGNGIFYSPWHTRTFSGSRTNASLKCKLYQKPVTWSDVITWNYLSQTGQCWSADLFSRDNISTATFNLLTRQTHDAF